MKSLSSWCSWQSSCWFQWCQDLKWEVRFLLQLDCKKDAECCSSDVLTWDICFLEWCWYFLVYRRKPGIRVWLLSTTVIRMSTLNNIHSNDIGLIILETWLECIKPGEFLWCTARKATWKGRAALALWWMLWGRGDFLCDNLCLLVLRCLLASDMQQCCYLEAPEHKHTLYSSRSDEGDIQNTRSKQSWATAFHSSHRFLLSFYFNCFLIYCLLKQHLKDVPRPLDANHELNTTQICLSLLRCIKSSPYAWIVSIAYAAAELWCSALSCCWRTVWELTSLWPTEQSAEKLCRVGKWVKITAC